MIYIKYFLPKGREPIETATYHQDEKTAADKAYLIMSANGWECQMKVDELVTRETPNFSNYKFTPAGWVKTGRENAKAS